MGVVAGLTRVGGIDATMAGPEDAAVAPVMKRLRV